MTPRLVNGAHLSGRLEVLEVGVWNTVCDHEFGNNEAQVVCRMLGLNRCEQEALNITLDYMCVFFKNMYNIFQIRGLSRSASGWTLV